LDAAAGAPNAGGYREHAILLVTEDGNQNLTGFPYGSAHNIVPA
jgi:creatinase